MIALSVTASRVAGVLRGTADLLEREGWDPFQGPVIFALDRAAVFTPGGRDAAGEELTLQAWDALVDALDGQLVVAWEQEAGRTQAEVGSALRAAAEAVSPS